MKTNKKVWKIVSVILALAMVVTLMPSGLFSGTTTVKAVSAGDEMFSSFSSTSPSASAWYDYDNSTPGWQWGANQSADGYSYGLAFADWFMSSGTVTGYAYYTVSSMPAGTYTLTCTVDYINIGTANSSKTTIYPYVGGSQVTSYSISPYVSSTWSTSASVTNGDFSYTFTLDEDQTNYTVGFYVAITAQQQCHLNAWSLTCDSLVDESGSSSGGTTTTTYEVEWADGNVPGTFESGTLGTSAPTGNGFYASSTSYVQRSTSYYNSGSYSAQMQTSNSGGMGSTSISLYYGADTSTGSTPSTSTTLSTSFNEYTYTFTATATTEYLVFATAYSSNSGQPGGSSSSTYYYLYGQITDLTVGTEYTVSFYARYYSNGNGGGATYYAYIDDVVVTYDVVETADPIYVPYDETNYPDNSQDYVGANDTADDFSDGWTVSGGSISNQSGWTNTMGSGTYLIASTWDDTSDGTMIAYYSQPYIFTVSSTYVVTYTASGSSRIEISAALFNSSGTLLTTLDNSVTFASDYAFTSADTFQTEVTIPDEYLNTEVYIGLYVSVPASTWVDITDFSWVYGELEEVENLDFISETYGIYNSDVSENWRAASGCSIVTCDDDYPFGAYTTYLGTTYWDSVGWSDDDGNYTEYTDTPEYATAYYKGATYTFSESGTYTWEGYIAGGYNAIIYPALYDTSGNLVTYFEAAAYSFGDEDVSWSDVTENVQVEFDITEDDTPDVDLTGATKYYIGVYIDLSASETAAESEGSWINMNNFSFYYGEAGDVIWDDQPENGDFEYGSGYAWRGYSDNESDDSGDYLYGYGVDQSASGVDGYAFNIWNNDENAYEFTVTQYIRMNTAGTYYIDYETIGENISGNMALYAMVDAYSEDYKVESAEFEIEVPGSYTDWTEYIPGYDSSLEDPWETAEGFTVEEGDIIVLTLYFYLEQYDYFSIDNIKFVQEGNEVMQGRTYIAVDCFENGGFEDTWNISQYWSDSWTDSEGTEYESDYDSSENGDYGFKIDSASSVVNSDYITDVDTEDNAVYFAWNNDTTSSHTFYLTQQIEVTTAGNYEFSADTRRWIYNSEDETDEGYATMYVYSADGDVIETMDLTPQGDDAWTTIESGKVSISEAQTITVVVEIYMPASYLAGQWDSDDDGTEDTDYYADSKICLDNFVFEEYVQITINTDGSYEAVTWTNSDGDTLYVNGGNFIQGVDISSVISEEAAGVKYDEDLFAMLKEVGVNYIRIRIFNDPYSSGGLTYGGGSNNSDVAAMIAQRAADYGMSVYLDFMISDFWADSGTQVAPKTWSSYSASQKASYMSEFVTETIEKVENTGANIEIVSIGNETNALAMSSSNTQFSSYSDFTIIFVACSQAVRAADSDIMVAVHCAPTKSGNSGGYLTWMLDNYKSANSSFMDYVDIFAASCYPYYDSHGGSSSGNDYSTVMSQLETIATSTTYQNSSGDNPVVMIAEYDWPWTMNADQDGSLYDEGSALGTGTDSTGSTYTTYAGSDGYSYFIDWACTVQGQVDMIQELIEASAGVTNMIGTFYFEPAWIGVNNWVSGASVGSWNYNLLQVWYDYGCGVATYEGATYLGWSGYEAYSSNGYNYACGSAEDERALIDGYGNAMASLYALSYSADTIPITTALAQVSTASDGYVKLRVVGMLDLSLDGFDTSSFDSVGFKIEYCASSSQIKTIAEKEVQTLYTAIKANGTTVYPDATNSSTTTSSDDANGYFYTYYYENIPASGTYYFKVITTATGQASYQQSIKYYSLVDGELSVIDAWDYPGTNATLTSASYSTLYPDYIK